jgi:hypothetical protein
MKLMICDIMNKVLQDTQNKLYYINSEEESTLRCEHIEHNMHARILVLSAKSVRNTIRLDKYLGRFSRITRCACSLGRRMVEWRYSSTILDLGITWRWVGNDRKNSFRCPLDRRLGELQSYSARCGVEKNFLPLPGIEPRPSST